MTPGQPTLDDMIREVERVLEQRQRLYSEWARTGKANKRRLNWQYDVMEAVLKHLKGERRSRRPVKGNR